MRLRVTGLQAGQPYAIQLRANNGEAVSEWSQRFLFTATEDTTIPATITGFVFVNGEAPSFYAEWDADTTNVDGSSMTDFDHYELSLFDNVSSTTQVINIIDTNYTLTLEQNRNLFITASDDIIAKVRAVDQYGNAGAWTSTIESINGDPPVVAGPDNGGFNANAIGIPDAIRFLWAPPNPMPADFLEYRVHMVVSNDAGTYAFTPDSTNLVWRGTATSMMQQSTIYDTDHFLKVVTVDVYGNRNWDNAIAVDHARPKDSGSGGTGGPPSGPAGGDLAGSYPDPSIAAGAVDGTKIDASIIDAAPAVASLRTLGTGSNQAAAGDDPRFSGIGGTTYVGDISIDCGGPTSDGVDIDCGTP